MLSLIMTSHNGMRTLPRTLESFTKLVPPEGGWKLFAVDNASTDETPRLLESFSDRLPMQIIRHTKLGQATSRNAAVPHTEGDIVVLTDDDVIAEPFWLVNMHEAAAAHPDYDIFGGAIKPVWPSKPPDWLLKYGSIGMTFAITSQDLTDGPLSPGLVWGPNMCVRRKIFEEGHRFDERFGPQPGRYRMGHETQFTTRLVKKGHRAWHVSSAVVNHIIRANQMDPEWVINRAYRFGRGMFWTENDPDLILDTSQLPPRGRRICGVPRWVYRELAEYAAKALAAKVRGDFEGWFRSKWEYCYKKGYLTEALSSEGREMTRINRAMLTDPIVST